MKGADSNIRSRRLTAPGRGAVASVRLSCSSVEDAHELSEAFVAANGTDPAKAPANRVLFGSWRGEDVVVVRTGELEWEVHCHGGEAAVTRILNEFSVEPSRVPDPSTLLDLLLRMRTPKTARFVLAQANGLLQDALFDAASCSEELGFRSRLEELLRWESVAQHLDQPWRVVIAGPPNVGKSSLLNGIAGYERVIVFDQPGTTRDAVQTELVIDGWLFRFVDTAGIRQESDGPIEMEGIRHAHRLLQSADFVLVAVDHSSGWQSDHETLLSALPEGTLSAVVRCKCDLSLRGNPVPRSIPQLETAAKTGSGITALTNWIVRQLIPIEPSINTPLPVVGSAALCRSLLRRLENGESLEILRCELWEILAKSPARVWKLHGSP